ncbi:MAG: glycogen-binding domain-containing protein [Gemmatimonas sp.]
MIRAMLAAAAASLVVVGAVSAQRVVSSVDVSGTGVWYADTVRSAGSSLSPALRVDWAHATLGASGNVSQLGNGGLSFQGVVAPSVFTPNAGPFTMELASSMGGSSHQDGTRTGQAIGMVRAHAMGSSVGAWAGGGVGRTWDGASWNDVRETEAGVWLRDGNITGLVSVSPTVVQDTIRYTDVQVAMRYPVGTFELGFTAGTRSGSVGAAVGGTSRAWGSASVIDWVSSRVAVVGSVGSYPVDLTQGYPGGRFVSLALRIASRNSRSMENVASTSASSVADPTPATSVAAFDVGTVRGSQRLLRVNAPSARSVELNGDFTQWESVRLTRGSDGWWSVTLPIAPGTHQMNIRVDGGRWIAPPGLLTSTDEFGGIVGLLTIE